MRRPRRILNCTLALAVCVTSLPYLAADIVRPINSGSGRVGLIVDGERAGETVNDRVYVEVSLGALFNIFSPVVVLDDFTLSDTNNEIVAFVHRRPPALLTHVPWTLGNNKVTVEFEDEYQIPVTVWIVKGPFAQQQALAAAHGVETSMIWEDERLGVAFSEFAIQSAVNDPEASLYYDFECAVHEATIQDDIGFEDGRINIYYVDRVKVLNSFGTGHGVWCGEGVIAMGSATGGGLLAHEIGHAFFLKHVNTDTEYFDTTNVMHSSSSMREFLTEGQTIRAIFAPASDLNGLYDIREGQPIKPCDHSTSTTVFGCPPIQKRIWADGDWPQN